MVIALVVLAMAGWITQIIPIVAGIAGAILALGTVWKTRGFVRGNELQGQIEQKNEIIRTNEQTIESFRTRVSSLEDDFKRVENRAKRTEALLMDSENTIISLKAQLKTVEKYAAPEAVQRLEQHIAEFLVMEKDMIGILEARNPIFADLKAALDRIEGRLNG